MSDREDFSDAGGDADEFEEEQPGSDMVLNP